MKSKATVILAVIILLLGVVYLAWDFWGINTSLVATSQAPAYQITQVALSAKVKSEVLATLAEMKSGYKFGQWPLGPVVLSQGRGNPFLAK